MAGHRRHPPLGRGNGGVHPPIPEKGPGEDGDGKNRRRYAGMISGKARVAGLIGWPVAHSLSPKLHNYWLSQYGIDGVYVPFPVRPEHLADVIRALGRMGVHGVNVTIPHKEAVMRLLDHVDEEARRIGAVNTITV